MQVGVGRCVGDPHRTVGGHDCRFEEAGGRRPVQVRIAPEPAAEDETGDTDRQAAAALNQAGAFRGHGVIDMAPDGPRPHRNRRKWSGTLARRDERAVQLVTRLTLRTHELPATAGKVNATIHAHSDAAFRRLIGRFVAFYAERLATPQWSDIVNLGRNNRLNISMGCLGLDQAQAEAIWQPFFAWVAGAGNDCSFIQPVRVFAGPARQRWDPDFLRARFPGAVRTDDRPGAPRDNIYWTADVAEAGHYIFGYELVWLPAALLAADRQTALADALFATSRIWPMELHFQKALAGARPRRCSNARHCDQPRRARCLCARDHRERRCARLSWSPRLLARFVNARHDAAEVAKAMAELRKVVPEPGSYLAETSFFERDWQKSFWGSNYPRLRQIKINTTPTGCLRAPRSRQRGLERRRV